MTHDPFPTVPPPGPDLDAGGASGDASPVPSAGFRLVTSPDPQHTSFGLDSSYVELFWTGVIFPVGVSLCRLLTHLALKVDATEHTVFALDDLDLLLDDGPRPGRSPTRRALHRLTHHGLAPIDAAHDDTSILVSVFTTVPAVPLYQQALWPDWLHVAHSEFLNQAPDAPAGRLVLTLDDAETDGEGS